MSGPSVLVKISDPLSANLCAERGRRPSLIGNPAPGAGAPRTLALQTSARTGPSIASARKVVAAEGKAGTSGLSLVELILALSIFSLVYVAVMGVAADSFGNVLVSRSRVAALTEAQSVLNQIRNATDLGVPEGIMEAFPPGKFTREPAASIGKGAASIGKGAASIGRGAPRRGRGEPATPIDPGTPGELTRDSTELRDKVVTISYSDPNTTPLFVTVSVRWTGYRGRVMTQALTTALTDL